MRIRSIMLAGVSLAIAVTSAVAADGGVYFRGTDSFGSRQARDAAPKLEFAPVTGLLLGGTATSEASTFTGPSDAFRITASGGEIRICPVSGQCGGWRTTGTVSDGDMVQARRAGPTVPGETVSVEVGGLGLIAPFDATAKASAPSLGSFASKTVSPDVVAESALSTFTGWVQTRLTVSGGEARVCASGGSCGSWSNSSDVHDGDQVQLRGTAGTFGTTRTVTASAGGATATFDVATRAKDTTPDAIAFGPAATDLEPGAVASSTIVTLAGFDDAPISIEGGSYSLNGGSWTTVAGTTKVGDTVQIRTTGGSFGETKTATLDVGGVKASFAATVRVKDTQPNAFAFAGSVGATPGTTVNLGTVTLAAFDGAPISVTGGEYALNGGAWTTVPGTAKAGDTVAARGVAPAFGETQTVTVDVGGVKGSGAVISRAKDTQPDAYALGTGPTNVEPASLSTSNQITLAGFDDAPISVSGTGATYSLNGAAYTTAAGIARAGDTVRVQLTAGTYSETRSATLNVGGVNGTWSSTVRAKVTTPNAFTFAAKSGSTADAAIVSDVVVLTGFDGATASVTASSGGGSPAFQVCSDTSCSVIVRDYSTASYDVFPGQYLKVRVTPSAMTGSTASVLVAVGGTSTTFSATAVAPVSGQCMTFGGTIPGCITGSSSPGQATAALPSGVTSYKVLAIGGGAGGPSGHQGGGGSGYVAFATCSVSGGSVTATAGAGGVAGPTVGINEIRSTDGAASTIAGCVTANGGRTPTGVNAPGGAGGSSGGGSCNAGSAGGVGGTNGAAGGNCTYTGGTAQGSAFSANFSSVTVKKITAGAGGAGGSTSHSGGGGGGGIVIGGVAPTASSGVISGSGKGGTGFGSGGGAGSYNGTYNGGGAGAGGILYLEW